MGCKNACMCRENYESGAGIDVLVYNNAGSIIMYVFLLGQDFLDPG